MAIMVASVGNSSSVANWSDAVFSKLDTKKQGSIDKSDLAAALFAGGDATGSGATGAVDDMFSAIDGDSDGKVTKSELSEAMTKVSDQLNAQFDAARVQGGMPPGPPPGGKSSGAASASSGADAGSDGTASSTSSTSSTSADYVAAADTDGDGTVSDAEQAAYDKKVASGQIDKNGNSTERNADGGTGQASEKDPARELAQALHMLKAYTDNAGNSDASAASTAGVSVEA
jgi:hypothetical protein